MHVYIRTEKNGRTDGRNVHIQMHVHTQRSIYIHLNVHVHRADGREREREGEREREREREPSATGTLGMPAMGNGGQGTVPQSSTVKSEPDAEEKDDRAFRALRRAFTEEGFCCTDAIIEKVLRSTVNGSL